MITSQNKISLPRWVNSSAMLSCTQEEVGLPLSRVGFFPDGPAEGKKVAGVCQGVVVILGHGICTDTGDWR